MHFHDFVKTASEQQQRPGPLSGIIWVSRYQNKPLVHSLPMFARIIQYLCLVSCICYGAWHLPCVAVGSRSIFEQSLSELSLVYIYASYTLCILINAFSPTHSRPFL